MTEGFQERPSSQVHTIHHPLIVWGLAKVGQNPVLHYIERSKEVNGGIHARQCIITVVPVLVLHLIARISCQHVGEIERRHNKLQYQARTNMYDEYTTNVRRMHIRRMMTNVRIHDELCDIIL